MKEFILLEDSGNKHTVCMKEMVGLNSIIASEHPET